MLVLTLTDSPASSPVILLYTDHLRNPTRLEANSHMLLNKDVVQITALALSLPTSGTEIEKFILEMFI
jgi:hypothetical protein